MPAEMLRRPLTASLSMVTALSLLLVAGCFDPEPRGVSLEEYRAVEASRDAWIDRALECRARTPTPRDLGTMHCDTVHATPTATPEPETPYCYDTGNAAAPWLCVYNENDCGMAHSDGRGGFQRLCHPPKGWPYDLWRGSIIDTADPRPRRWLGACSVESPCEVDRQVRRVEPTPTCPTPTPDLVEDCFFTGTEMLCPPPTSDLPCGDRCRCAFGPNAACPPCETPTPESIAVERPLCGRYDSSGMVLTIDLCATPTPSPHELRIEMCDDCDGWRRRAR